MARKKSVAAEKGSQRDIQVCFNSKGAREWLARYRLRIHVAEWMSPMEDDSYAEYSDQDFMNRIGCGSFSEDLKEFWPNGGPVWDGLARAKDGTVLLFEAKSHVSEFFGMGSKAKSPRSIQKIDKALRETAEYIGAIYEDSAWTDSLYQMANRLAFLYFLNIKIGVRARLYYLIFTNDTSVVSKPESEDVWRSAIEIAERYILKLPMSRAGVGPGRAFWRDWVKDIFVDVNDIGVKN